MPTIAPAVDRNPLGGGAELAYPCDLRMELGYRHPVEPLRSADLVGLDVRLAIAQHLHTTLGERFARHHSWCATGRPR